MTELSSHVSAIFANTSKSKRETAQSDVAEQTDEALAHHKEQDSKEANATALNNVEPGQLREGGFAAGRVFFMRHYRARRIC